MSTVITYAAFGGPDVLQVEQEDVPEPGPGQVVVANRAVGVNPADWKVLAGAFGERELPATLGFEAAGVVTAVGEGVESPEVGDEVIWHGDGAQREHAAVDAAHTVPKPAALTWAQAAVLPVAAASAFSALVQVDVGPQDTVLVHGASGGVGSAAVQIALALGAQVVGTASEANHDYLRGLGAQPVAYGDGLVEAVRGLGGVTAVVDAAGTAESVAATVALLDDVSRAVAVAHSDAAQEAGIAVKRDQKGALAEVVALAESGRLAAEIAERFPLTEAAAALALVQEGHTRGKVVLTV
ncbi:NADP-dependent oxidoreductase [Cellulomonas sp. PhB143]|uniref:NADP-dependent oxidoreductase n=1 Tax=Cellulomonas sp. PhB143 TaxID=2485186 RepID=UPI000F46A99B|nr:NADP-dependent oxidoreductase [Cellulomonas sp. PhB143]ROS79113.1 NADPH:quinone reductase-like Zn-dependent oxidoreductase [Cellulomonas sp. PhB143]